MLDFLLVLFENLKSIIMEGIYEKIYVLYTYSTDDNAFIRM